MFLDDGTACTVDSNGGTITFDGNAIVTGNIELQTGEHLTVNSVADLASWVANNKLTIRAYESNGVVEYPAVEYTTFGTGDGVTGSPTSTVTFGSNTVTFGFNAKTTTASAWGHRRTRGRSSVQRNHRGMQPRAATVDFSTATPEEITALQLLRQLVGQDEFRRYLKYGFVMVRGQSGLRYQIQRGRHVVSVWNERGRVDGICVYLSGDYPPTDDTIARMLMAERDELELWRRGNSRTGRDATVADLARLYGAVKVAA